MEKDTCASCGTQAVSRPSDPNPLLAAALDYAALGIPVKPLYEIGADGRCSCSKRAACGNAGKHPRTPEGTEPSTDLEQIRRWWTEWPYAGIGIYCGVIFDALDVDCHEGTADGRVALVQLELELGPLPDTVLSLTGGGGQHWLFRHVDGLRMNLPPNCGLEWHKAGYIVAPPTMHKSGRAYQWGEGRGPGAIPFAEVPAAWQASQRQAPAAAEQPRTGNGTRRYGAKALREEAEKVMQAMPGTRDNTLCAAALKIGGLVAKGHITLDDARAALVDAGCRMRSDETHEPWSKRAVEQKVDAKLAEGMKRPRGPDLEVERTPAPRRPAPAAAASEAVSPTQDVGEESEDSGLDLRPHIPSSGDLAEAIDASWAALTAANDPPRLLRFGNHLAVVEDVEGEAGIRTLSVDALREELARCAWWFTRTAKGDAKPTHPPKDVPASMLASNLGHVPALRRLLHAPIMAPSGRLVTEAGYDRETRCWLVPGVTVPRIPDAPTDDQVEAAVDVLLEDLLVDFPFVADADRANTLALYLLPFARELIDGNTPLHLVEKPAPGSGASLLIEILGLLVRGGVPAPMTEGRTEDEWRKRVTSTLMGSPEIVAIDNVHRLDSAALSAVLTAGRWEDRRLGTSENVVLPVRCVWTATGNNPVVSSEIARRCVSIRIDPKMERPHERTGFRHPKIGAWTLEHRGALLGAALTLLRAWDKAGRPGGDASLGSYEQWAHVMGGILQVARVPGFLENRQRFYDRADREAARWGAFIAAWLQRYEQNNVQTRDLWALLEQVDPPVDLGNGSERSQRTKLGEAIGGAIDRRYLVDGTTYRIEDAGTRKRLALYRLAAE